MRLSPFTSFGPQPASAARASSARFAGGDKREFAGDAEVQQVIDNPHKARNVVLNEHWPGGAGGHYGLTFFFGDSRYRLLTRDPRNFLTPKQGPLEYVLHRYPAVPCDEDQRIIPKDFELSPRQMARLFQALKPYNLPEIGAEATAVLERAVQDLHAENLTFVGSNPFKLPEGPLRELGAHVSSGGYRLSDGTPLVWAEGESTSYDQDNPHEGTSILAYQLPGEAPKVVRVSRETSLLKLFSGLWFWRLEQKGLEKTPGRVSSPSYAQLVAKGLAEVEAAYADYFARKASGRPPKGD